MLGGSEIEAQRVCKALIAKGHQVEVLCAGGDPMPPLKRWVDPAGVPVRLFGGNQNGAWRDYVYAWGVAWTLLKERGNYDFVYFLMQGLHLAVGLPVARLLGKPILMKVGGSNVIPLMAQSNIGRLELHWLRRWAYRVMLLNDGMVDEALAEGFERQQLLWMPNPVDVHDFAPCSEAEKRRLREQFAVPEEARVVVYVGRLSPEKGVDLLIESFAPVAHRNPGSLLVLVGDGAQRKELEALAKQLQLTPAQIRFAGRVDPLTVRKWLQAGDIFSLVSPSEGFPCAVVEAMSVGLASVVSHIPANTQLIDQGEQGLLAPFGDREQIGAALEQLLNDRAASLRMGTEARKRVIERYSTEKVLDRYEDLFREMAG